MATRPIFVPISKKPFFEKLDVEFEWHPGFSLVQKQKSLESLHRNAKKQYGLGELLEISSKSPVQIGNRLSAFNLKAHTKDENYCSNMDFSLETVFQTSKVFKKNIHCVDLLGNDQREIRKLAKEREPLGLTGFRLEGADWSLKPKGAFYNFIYIKSLLNIPEIREKLIPYEGFTDIEFNQKKSINCQAEAVSMYTGLRKGGIDPARACSGQAEFLRMVYGAYEKSGNETVNFLDSIS